MEQDNKAKKILNYSLQLSMLKKLFKAGLVSETEYEEILKSLRRDYCVVSEISIN